MKKLFTLLTLALTAVSGAWAEATTIYSMTAVTGPTTSLAQGDIADVTATFVGGTAQVCNGKSSAVSNMGQGQINLGGSGASYFHATLTSETIAEGDIISLSGSGTMFISATSTKGSSVTFPYTVPNGSDLIGNSDVYLWKDGVKNFTSFTISRPAADDVANPVITQSGSSVTITCSTDGATIYYTTDGSTPTSSSTTYSAEITITDPCTVRAIAIKGENSSSLMLKDCYVSHATAKAVLGYNGGNVSGDVWTSTDGNYILTDNVEGRGQNAVSLAGSNDGFKLNHTDNYTLKISNNIKVTKIVVVGKSWLKGSEGNASTIAFDGFTPASGSFYDYVDETYVKTIEFIPESELGYGATITMRPGSNQLGAYIEIYGEEYAPSSYTYEDTTWDFSAWSDATKTGLIDDATNWLNAEKDGGTDWSDGQGRSNINAIDGALQYSSTNIAETEGLTYTGGAYSMAIMFNYPSTSLGTYHGSQYLWLYGNKSVITIPSVTKGSIIEIGVESHKASEARGVTLSNATQIQGDATAKTYQVCKWTINKDGNVTVTPSKGLHIYYIKLSKASAAVSVTPAKDMTTYVTTKALDFTGVEGLKAYVATAASASAVTITEVEEAVPAGTPLLLIGTAGTEYTVPVAASATAPATNLLKAGDGTTEFDGTTNDYILYSDGLFYQIGSGSVAVGKAYLHLDSAPSASALKVIFSDEEVTGIDAIRSTTENGIFYNLAGQRVNQPTKGMYIVNGKKVIIK
ncbi:MAG: chitobiase/beta-hexosaminidase C-terminal domain-containing protein [Bacteroidales bacterium]|nr:chitobiase/beta-hexosaminidase C-terminal domain-containing protein [Bacteroidales bacterium]